MSFPHYGPVYSRHTLTLSFILAFLSYDYCQYSQHNQTLICSTFRSQFGITLVLRNIIKRHFFPYCIMNTFHDLPLSIVSHFAPYQHFSLPYHMHIIAITNLLLSFPFPSHFSARQISCLVRSFTHVSLSLYPHTARSFHLNWAVHHLPSWLVLGWFRLPASEHCRS